jgi:hypothetical protein
MTDDNSPATSRRSLLAWAGAGAITAAAVPLGAGTASAAAYPASGSALLVPSARLDLNSPAENWIREKSTRDATIIQAIGYDNVNRHIYLTQVTQGGLQLAGESAPVSAADRNKNGDLTVTKWDMAGNTLGYMYLRGFGHGSSIGVEPVGAKGYLWTEVDSVTIEDKPGEFSSRGTRLARFPFTSGQVLDKTSAALAKYTPVPGSTRNGVSVDPVYGRLVVRYRDTDGVTKYQVHDLDLARLDNWTKPLAVVSEPNFTTIPGWPLTTYGNPFLQGFASVGRYLYMLHGNAYGDTQEINGQTVVISQPGHGNTFLSCLDLTTGNFAPAAPSPWVDSVNPCHTEAAYTLDYREPEGLAVYIPDIDRPGVFSLGMGFASGPAGARRATIYGKSVLIQP